MKRLERLLSEGEYLRRGRVTLKSGRYSDFYVDIKAACGEPTMFAIMVRGLAALVDRKSTCIAGAGYGGLPLATAVAIRLKLPLTLVRERRKAHGTRQWLEGHRPVPRDRVAIIDDVFTSGTSIRHTERILRRTGARIIGRYVVVDRSGRDPSPVRSLLTLS